MATIFITDKGVYERIEYYTWDEDAAEAALYLCRIPEHYVLETDDFCKAYEERESLEAAKSEHPYCSVAISPCMASHDFEWFKAFVPRYGHALDRLEYFEWEASREVLAVCDDVWDLRNDWLTTRECADGYVWLMERILDTATDEPESYDAKTILPVISKALDY